MEEARRFLRYVLPGFVFAVETLVFVFLVFPEWVLTTLTSVFTKESGTGLAIAGVFASGALGYIFATIHHWILWHLRCERDILNHSAMVNRLLRGQAVLGDCRNTEVDREVAFQIVIALWHQRIRGDGKSETKSDVKAEDKVGSITKATNEKLSSLGDQLHGLGAARVASAAALLVTSFSCGALVGRGKVGCDFGSWVLFILAVAVVCVLGWLAIKVFTDGYRRVARHAQGVFERVLEEALTKEPPTELFSVYREDA
jgi:hypothetical protein